MQYPMDFLKLLDSDASLMIFKHLDAPADLVRVSAVSHAWQDFVIDHAISKQLALKKYPQLSCVARVALVSEAEIPNDAGSSSSVIWENKKWDHIIYTSLMHQLESSTNGSCIVEAICASSTDNYPVESINNTLIQSDRIAQRASYWSSEGQSDPNVPERLIYRLKSNLCLIREIHIRPFQAYFQLGHPIYSSKFVRFRMGHTKFPLDRGTEEDMPLDHITDQHFVWTYTSPEYPMLQEKKLQKFQLPEPTLCIGGFLMIELLGRVQKQEVDYLYYICVSHVRADGMPLSPKFTVKTLKNAGEFVLQYNPQAVIDSPDDGIRTTNNTDAEAQGNQNWAQFMNMQIMNMLQAYVPGYPNHHVVPEAEEDEDEDDDDDEEEEEDEDGDGEFI
ncbi:unnamed protein product [Rhodiola kirilowii]